MSSDKFIIIRRFCKSGTGKLNNEIHYCFEVSIIFIAYLKCFLFVFCLYFMKYIDPVFLKLINCIGQIIEVGFEFPVSNLIPIHQ